MFVNVDIIGVEAVLKMLQQTNLKKFIVYSQGSGKGAIPKYECTHTNNNSAALKCFKDWATNVLMFNQTSAQTYDLLCFDTVDEIDSEKRTNKVRFSFALSGSTIFNQYQNNAPQPPQIDLQSEIQKGIEMAMLKKEVEELRQFKKEVEEDEDDEDDEDKPDILDKIGGIMQQFNMAQQGAQVSGDLDTEKMNQSDIDKQIKLENQRKALKILWSKNNKLDLDLLRLAKLAETNPILFKMTIGKLRQMVPDVN